MFCSSGRIHDLGNEQNGMSLRHRHSQTDLTVAWETTGPWTWFEQFERHCKCHQEQGDKRGTCRTCDPIWKVQQICNWEILL